MIRSQTSRERCAGEGRQLGPERPAPGQSGIGLIEHDDDDDAQEERLQRHIHIKGNLWSEDAVKLTSS